MNWKWRRSVRCLIYICIALTRKILEHNINKDTYCIHLMNSLTLNVLDLDSLTSIGPHQSGPCILWCHSCPLRSAATASSQRVLYFTSRSWLLCFSSWFLVDLILSCTMERSRTTHQCYALLSPRSPLFVTLSFPETSFLETLLAAYSVMSSDQFFVCITTTA